MPEQIQPPMKTICYYDMHDGDHTVGKITEEEWQKLIAPAVKNNWPIDGATVDHDVLERLEEKYEEEDLLEFDLTEDEAQERYDYVLWMV